MKDFYYNIGWLMKTNGDFTHFRFVFFLFLLKYNIDIDLYENLHVSNSVPRRYNIKILDGRLSILPENKLLKYQ